MHNCHLVSIFVYNCMALLLMCNTILIHSFQVGVHGVNGGNTTTVRAIAKMTPADVNRYCVDRICDENAQRYFLTTVVWKVAPAFPTSDCRDFFFDKIQASAGENPCIEMRSACHRTCGQLTEPNVHNGEVVAARCLRTHWSDYHTSQNIKHSCEELNEAADCIINPTNECIQDVEGGNLVACLACNTSCHLLNRPMLAEKCEREYADNEDGAVHCKRTWESCKELDEAADCIMNPTNECIQNVEGGHYTACLACNTSCHLLNQPMLAANCEREYANEEGSAAYCKQKWNKCIALVKCTECSRTCNRLLPNNDYGQLLGQDCLRKGEASICDDMKEACEAIHESTDCIANPTVTCIRNVPENRYFICLVCAYRCGRLNYENSADFCAFQYSSTRGQLEQCRNQWLQCESQGGH